jgi:ABC-type multidrug transport system fused ATPase/permease subunit
MLDILITNFISKHKLTFFLYIVLILVFFPIQGLVLPNVYGKLYDSMKTNTKFGELTDIINNIKKQNFAGLIVILLILWLIIIMSYSAKGIIETLIFPEYTSYLRTIVYEKLIETHKSNYTDIKTGDYLTRIMEFTKTCSSIFQYIITRFLPETVIVLFIIVYMFYKNKNMGMVLCLSLILCIIIQYIGGNYLVELIAEKETHFNTVIGENVQDSLDNLMNIYINNETTNEINKNTKNENDSTEKTQKILNIQQLIVFATEIVCLVSYGVCLIILYYLLKEQKISTSHSIVLILILGQYLNYFMGVNSGYLYYIISKIGILYASKDYLNEILKPTNQNKKRDVITKGKVEFKNVSFKYNTESSENLFENLNFVIEGGSNVALLGRSGSGKTTIMKMIVGLYKPTSGTIYIDGVDINEIDVEYLRKEVIYVNQRTNMFNETVLYNMRYGNEVSEEDVEVFLKKYGLDEIFNDLPDGIRGKAGVHGGNLSGGMQKMIILVRGILKKGRIIMLDEPIAGLDRKTVDKVKSMIREEKKSRTIIIISHEELIVMRGLELK